MLYCFSNNNFINSKSCLVTKPTSQNFMLKIGNDQDQGHPFFTANRLSMSLTTSVCWSHSPEEPSRRKSTTTAPIGTTVDDLVVECIEMDTVFFLNDDGLVVKALHDLLHALCRWPGGQMNWMTYSMFLVLDKTNFGSQKNYPHDINVFPCNYHCLISTCGNIFVFDRSVFLPDLVVKCI